MEIMELPPKELAIVKKRRYTPNALSVPAQTSIIVFFSIYTLLCILPLLLVLAVSFTDEKTIAAYGYSFIPKSFSLDAYRYLIKDWQTVARSYGVTVLVTTVGSVTGLFMTACYAYPLSRKHFRLRHVFSFFVFFTMLFKGGLVPMYMVYNKYLHVGNTIYALIIPNLLMGAFYVLMMRTFFTITIPNEVYESAEIDGAGDLRIFFRIVLPLSKPVLATVGLFYTLSYWNDWFNSMIFINNDNIVSLQYLMQKTLLNIQYLLNNPNLTAQARIDFPGESARMAMAIIGIGPIVFAYPFFQRYFIQGLTVGAVKG